MTGIMEKIRCYGRLYMPCFLEVRLREKGSAQVIRLEPADLNELKKYYEPKQISGMSILFRVIGEQIQLENTGGINAPALMGRFSVIDESIKQAAQEMACQVEDQNPELIFAELLHLSDHHTDNINRREHIYRYEIPIIAASAMPKNQQIELSDLYLTIDKGSVWLFSKKHQKFVIPRTSSAYNHRLNKLPLFRFLADLPYQYSRFDLSRYFPKLGFYPRVQVDGVIISLGTWIVDAENLTSFQVADEEFASANFLKFSEEVKLSRYFILTEGDQELVFDRSNKQEVLFFCRCIRQKKEIIIKEYLAQRSVKQYNAFLLPAEKLVHPVPDVQLPAKLRVKRKLIPGLEWLYLKIYSPGLGANRLLLRIRPLLKKQYTQTRITRWFFIWYQDPTPHIRLRLMIAPESIGEVLLQAFAYRYLLIFANSYNDYLPMQNFEKILSSKSSVVTAPVISPR